MRDDIWLKNLLEELWERHFYDVEKRNEINIKFGRKSKRRLGSIRLTKNNVSLITITGLYKNLKIPDLVIIDTITHELVHYVHGFSSTLEKKFDHPHRGNIIKRELTKRGLLEINEFSNKWLKKNWSSYLRNNK